MRKTRNLGSVDKKSEAGNMQQAALEARQNKRDDSGEPNSGPNSEETGDKCVGSLGGSPKGRDGLCASGEVLTEPPGEKTWGACGDLQERRSRTVDVTVKCRNQTIKRGCREGARVGTHLESQKKTRSKAYLKE